MEMSARHSFPVTEWKRMQWPSVPLVLFLWSTGILFSPPPYPASAASFALAERSLSRNYLEEGMRSYQRGDFEQAVSNWTEAARVFERAGKRHDRGVALTYLAQAYQEIGQYKQALQNLKVALALAEQSGDRARLASVLGSLGNVYIATGPAETAAKYLRESLDMAREAGNSALEAGVLNNLGNLFASQRQYPEALRAYTASTRLAVETGSPSLAARALINAAKASAQGGRYREAKALIDEALDRLRGLGHSHDKAYGLISIGLVYRDLQSHFPDAKDLLLRLAANTLDEAATVAEAIGDRRATSYAWGYLGQLYEHERRYQEALRLTRRAIFAAQQVQAPESLYRWQWQTGRLLKALGHIDDAISAYRRAVAILQPMRQELLTSHGSAPSSFRESIGPVYFELVDLLLQRAASLQRRDQYEPYLIEARETVELLKAAELRDYFRDDCVDAARSRITRLEAISQAAVVVYPILLPDRIELLVSLPTGLKRFAVPVAADSLTREVREFRRKLEKRTTREYLPHAQKLYEWLVRPLEPDMAPVTVDSLVFVPDGPLRTIPMAALHDGEQFLISKYAVATTPGIDLTDPRAIKRENMKALAVGLTESVQGFPPLPSVSAELQAIQGLYGGDLLLNQDFLVSRLEKELREEQFTIVHIASHGRFESDAAKTFLLTFDDKLTMERLDQFVGLFRFRDEPLELLALSACETAAGDDRAALGLAGVAIKAGARSALATLWHIDDPASSALIAEFYRQLRDPSISRATALQRAQLHLLRDPRYQHPGYWSPFLLINNWL
jgi:CHAT domain-containing protein/uncharacterized protein HemY